MINMAHNGNCDFLLFMPFSIIFILVRNIQGVLGQHEVRDGIKITVTVLITKHKWHRK